MLGLRFCVRAFSSCGKRGPLFIAVHGPLTIAASLVAERRLQTHRLSSCGSRAYLLCGMWDLPRPGLEPVSPALTGRFSTTAPWGKPQIFFKICPTTPSAMYVVWGVTCWFLPDPFPAFSLFFSGLRGLNPAKYIARLLNLCLPPRSGHCRAAVGYWWLGGR